MSGMKSPCAFLFRNGNAAFFDPDEQQIVKLQRLGWCGLHGFLAQYPDAPVSLQGGLQPDGIVEPELLPWLLRNIARRQGPRP